jgi:hypothetical protein
MEMTTMTATLFLSSALAMSAWSFRGIVRRYRTLRGFPWLLSAVFAAAAITAVLTLHVLFGS